jgi:superfamily II DNA helicase RecQ
MTNSHQLDRIIFDEAHLLVGQRHFREAFNHIRQLGLITTPKLYILATIPLHVARELTKMLHLPSGLTIQTSINKPNLYWLVHYW